MKRIVLLAFFFSIIPFTNSWANSSPEIIGISPSSGTFKPNTAYNFTATYKDSDGYSNIKNAYLLVNSSLTPVKGFYAYYSRPSNRVYFWGDNNKIITAIPGSSTILENSYIKVDCSKTTISRSGTTLAVNWNITFKSTFTGSKKVYMNVSDNSISTGWTQKGTWRINSSPEIVGISPSSGTFKPNTAYNFTATYKDLDGYSDIRNAYLIVNSSLTPTKGFYAYYSRPSNRIYFWGDNNRILTATPGSSTILENSYVKVDCSKTAISRSGTTLAVNWNITFKSKFTGSKKVYMSVSDSFTSAGWTQKGTWRINSSPEIVGISPSSGTFRPNTAYNFTATYADPAGYSDIRTAYLLINASLSTKGFYGYYDRSRDKIYLLSDTNSWMTAAPGSSAILENSYVKVDCSKTTTSGSGTTLAVNWNITFKSTFTGVKNAYMLVRDSTASAGWTQKGALEIVADTIPPAGSLTINNNSQYSVSTAVTLNLSAEDDQGGTGLAQMKFSDDNTAWSDPETYNKIKSWTLTPGDGAKTVYVKFSDNAGNWSGAYSDSITLDTTPPDIVITSPADGATLNEAALTVNYIVDGAANTKDFTLVEGANTLTITETDAAGNASTVSIAVNMHFPPVADFTVTPVTGQSPLTVQFADKTTGNATSYNWDFGDGQTSDLQNPAHIYELSGWSVNYNTVALPHNSGWSKYSVGNNYTEGLQDGVLYMRSGFVEGGLNYSRTPGFKAADGYTIETRFRLGTFSAPVTYGGMGISVFDDSYYWRLDFMPGAVGIAVGAEYIGMSYLDTTSDYHTYRMVAKNGIVNVYIDGTKEITADVASLTLGSYVPSMAFGSFCGGTGPETWNTEGWWDYVKVLESNLASMPTEKYYTVSLTATGPGGSNTGLKSNLIQVTANLPEINTGSLPDSTVNEEYSAYLVVSNGTSPHMWSVESGNLPDGLTIDSVFGTISGTPTKTGTYDFTVKVTDSNMFSAVKTFSLKVLLSPDEQLLDDTQAKAALYFYNEILPNGFVKDGNHKEFSSIAATGFGLASLCVMAERYGTTAAWTVTPELARARVNKILDECIRIQNLQESVCNQYGVAGFLCHFINASGACYGSSEISTVDMALFLAGAVTAGEYFGGEVKTKVEQIYSKLNWGYFFVPSKKQFSHGYSVGGTLLSATWDRPGDEALIVSLMALGSDPENKDFLAAVYSQPRTVRAYGSHKVVNSYFSSLFTYIFAHCYFDFEKLGKDNPLLSLSPVGSVDWWANSVAAANANRQFCIDQAANYSSYGPDSWGITACEYPAGGYAGSIGAAPCEVNNGTPIHDGTIAPYGAISSMPFMRTAPDENLADNLSFKALKFYYDTYYNNLWGPYGPRDSFNSEGEFDSNYLGIDVGPEVLMIENYRTGLPWAKFMSNNRIKAATAKVFNDEGLPEPTTLYVDAANSADTNQDGSQTHPFSAIQKAIDVGGSNIIVNIAPGQYLGKTQILAKLNITLKGIIGDRNNPVNTAVNTVIDNTVGDYSLAINNSRDVVVDSIVITGHDDPNVGSSGILVSNSVGLVIKNTIVKNLIGFGGMEINDTSNVIISNNTIKQNEGVTWPGGIGGLKVSGGANILVCDNAIIENHGWPSGGGVSAHADGLVIRNNLIYKNRANEWGGGLVIGGTNVTVSNNIIANNYTCGGWYPNQGAGGILCRADDAIFTNNTIYGNEFYIGSYRVKVANNIIKSCIVTCADPSLSPLLTYNNVLPAYGGSGYSYCVPGVGSISEDPLFVAASDGDDDPYNDDYHLKWNSPCINTGDPDPIYVDKDGSRNDMGAYGGPAPFSLDGV
ncbi:MAG: glucoamylase family protein [Candidatus Omnitrophica bacterium]|nr:glucoamylase family protein [Candidatus Omnitrophota bacterium]